MVHCSKLLPPLYELPMCFPRYYGGVLLVGAGSFALNMYMAGRVMKARKKWDIQSRNHAIFPDEFVCWWTSVPHPKNRCRGLFGFIALGLLMLHMSVTGVQHLVASIR
ncbi:unnamed protein product [Dibothriocephalus latus]|uniref:Uncharacterized protein n=1 Tax=Dibothriocephalus latus TaxID=60516 RepID=A0A3P7NKY7_DIBLA|nr:unnamed protein product [Dibothriocephalus latus]